MKKSSFTIALALICIFFFSCDDKSVISPQNEDFKITGISSSTGSSGSKVIVYGKNLDCNSLEAVIIGGSKMEIISRSDDSIVAIVPSFPEGSYNFTTLSKAGIKRYVSEFDILKLEPLKITKISSTIGYVNSQLILYGENLNNGIYLEVKIGEIAAEILKRTKDSIIIKIPKMSYGLYEINLKSLIKSFVFSQKYRVMPIDFSLFKNFSIYGSGLQAEYEVLHEWRERIWEEKGSGTQYEPQFGFSAHNNKPIYISINSGYSYSINENSSTNDKQIKNEIVFIHNPKTHLITSLKVNCYEASKAPSGIFINRIKRTLKFDISDMNYSFDISNRILSLQLKGEEEISQKLLNFQHIWYYGLNSTINYDYDYNTYTVKRIRCANNKAYVRITFSM